MTANEIQGWKLKNKLPDAIIRASAPCRVDLGGTLDISTFYLPLARFRPITFNAAVDLRTQVSIEPLAGNAVKISSKGFDNAEFTLDQAPFDHPLGLMFAVAAHFGAEGVHIKIDSSSPVRSALGGSSSAAVALVAAFFAAYCPETAKRKISKTQVVLLAHALEQSVAGVPCGVQDQLAAAYGGVSAWRWNGFPADGFSRQKMFSENSGIEGFTRRLLIAYCGIPHESKDINGRWVKNFISGRGRRHWKEIIGCAQSFVDALSKGNYKEASRCMNRETEIRRRMTPDVLDEMGEILFQAAKESGCGARFTGAGGGGCMWAIGEAADVVRLKGVWENLLTEREGARLLDCGIDRDGLLCDHLLFKE